MNPALAKLAPAPAPATSDKQWKLGPAVVNGSISYFSVSQLQDFAACERLWWFAKVKRLPKKQIKAQQLGTDAHKQWAHYLQTGEDVLGDIARIAKPLLPAPGPDLLVEQQFCPTDTENGHLLSPVRAAGIPLVGDIDLVNPRRLATEGVVRVTDHKTSSNPEKYSAKPESLRRIDLAAIRADAPGAPGAGIQTIGYGIWVLAQFDGVRRVELEHIVTPTKAPKKFQPQSTQVLTSATPDEIRREWQTVDALAERAKQVARAETLADVRPNWSACEKYGGCSFRTQCLTYQSKEKHPMGVMDLLKKSPAATAAAVPTPPPAQPPERKLVVVDQSTTPDATLKAFGSLLVASCELGTEYVIDVNGTRGEFTGTAKGRGFFQTPNGSVVLPIESKVEPVPAAKPEPEPVVVYDAGQAPATPKTTAPVEVAQPAPVAEAVEEKPKRTRKPKADEPVPAVQPAAEALRILVDTVPNGPAESLNGYLAKVIGEIEKAFDVVDIRCAPARDANGKDHPLAFGKWKGALAGAIKADPPRPGTYLILGAAGSELVQVAIEALEPLCAPGNFYRGVR